MRNLQRWRGVVLLGGVSALILVFYFSGQLSFFIHPRYNVFTVAMATFAVVVTIAAFALLPAKRSQVTQTPSLVAGRSLPGPKTEGADHGHDDDHDHGEHDVEVPTTPWGRAIALVAGGLSLAALITLAVLPPATLSTVTVENRSLNQAALGDTVQAFADAQGGSEATFLAFTVREWAGILRQTQDPAFFQGKPVDVVGFVVADTTDRDVFFVTRFAVSCCSVDAQPIGIPVYFPGWEDSFATEEWVRVSGEFVMNPNAGSSHPLVVRPREVTPSEQPRDPYLF